MKNSDFNFFTNLEEDKLLNHFQKKLPETQFFDIMVGYFNLSAFRLFFDDLKNIEKIRILIGIGATGPNIKSHKQHHSKKIIEDLETLENSLEVDSFVEKIIDCLENKKIEIRGYRADDRKIHSKVYIKKYFEENEEDSVIIGSSNFSRNGFENNIEFNIELKGSEHTHFPIMHFENMWEVSSDLDLTQLFLETTKSKSRFQHLEPKDIYYRTLYKYFENQINRDNMKFDEWPDDHKKLEYQEIAVSFAVDKLNVYNGLFLSDVVGLGKTRMSAMIASQFRKLWHCVIGPPALEENWDDTFANYGIAKRHFVSRGNLKSFRKELERGEKKADIIFIDESHYFKNSDTKLFEDIHEICKGRKVVLVSATPFNNKFDDIFTQISLFQKMINSSIPGFPNLQDYQSHINKELRRYRNNIVRQDQERDKQAQRLRREILDHIMIRRTRSQVLKTDGEVMKREGISFPDVEEPRAIDYFYSGRIDVIFNQTLNLIKEMKFTRYSPIEHLKTEFLHEYGLDQDDQSFRNEKNLLGFLKSTLLKRLESSFFCFRKSVKRFSKANSALIQMADSENSKVYFFKRLQQYDFHFSDNIDEHLNTEERFYYSDHFKDSFIDGLQYDQEIIEQIIELWTEVWNSGTDPKINKLLEELNENQFFLEPALKNGKKQKKPPKLIIFSEFKETAEYLFERISEKRPSGRKPILAHGQGGRLYDESSGEFVNLNKKSRLREVKANFDDSYESNKREDFQILIATDVLSEGVNLHQSNIVINYDMTWNPVKVMQRVGRVNRLSTKFDRVLIFNFFPCSSISERDLPLKRRSCEKIEIFHKTLGEDSKYLTGEENPRSYNWSSSQTIKNFLKFEDLDDGDETYSHEYFLSDIRSLMKNERDYFLKIKSLPSSLRCIAEGDAKEKGVLSFFINKDLKKFIFSSSGYSKEIAPIKAFLTLQNQKESTGKYISKDSNFDNDLLNRNLNHFQSFLNAAVLNSKKGFKKDNAWLLNRFIFLHEQNDDRKPISDLFTSKDVNDYQKILKRLESDIVPKTRARKIKKNIQDIERKTDLSLEDVDWRVFHLFKEEFQEALNSKVNDRKFSKHDTKIICSEQFINS